MTDLPENASKTMLVSFINRLKAIADEIGDLQADATEICKEARGEGFDSTKLREVVAWLRKVDKHGAVKMEEAEALFDLYRSVHQAGAKPIGEAMSAETDAKLLALFTADDQAEKKLNQRRKSMRDALSLAKGAREARGG